jgi:nucleotide-binding universal stress UspA family protein
MASILSDAVIDPCERTIQDAKRKLGLFFTEGKRNGVDVETLIVEGDVTAQILRTAQENCADLIVLPISRKTHLERTMFGTTAERVVRGANIPVLSIPVRVHDELIKTRG